MFLEIMAAFLMMVGTVTTTQLAIIGDECDPVLEQCDCRYSWYHKRDWCDWVKDEEET